MHNESLRMWVRQAQADAGKRSDVLSTVQCDRLRLLEREVKELRRQNEVLRPAVKSGDSEYAGSPRVLRTLR